MKELIDLIVYYSTSTNNTHEFVQKLGIENIRIPKKYSDPLPIVDRPFCLILPTYKGGKTVTGEDASAIPTQVKKFLDIEENLQHCKLSIVGGNINFGEDFCIAGDHLKELYGIPYKYRFELRGNQEDVDIVTHALKNYQW